MRIWPFSLFLVGVLTLSSQVAWSTERDTLGGLTEVGVLVESLKDDLQDLGLSQTQLQTDVELRLRLAGIVVSDRAESYLYLNVNGFKSGEHLYVYCVRLELVQRAMLKRAALSSIERSEDGSTVGLVWREISSPGGSELLSAEEHLSSSFATPASTWDTGSLGAVGAGAEPRATIRGAVKDSVDIFVNDYLAKKQEGEELQRRLEEWLEQDRRNGKESNENGGT